MSENTSQVFQYDEAHNGLEALNKFKDLLSKPGCSGVCLKPYYKLIIMDLQMPEMDGFQSTEKILEALHDS